MVRVSGTHDKARMRFDQVGIMTTKIQEAIRRILFQKWENLVTIVRWPRSNIVELKLSAKMVRSAGFLEIQQELTAFWRAVLRSLARQAELTQVTTKTKRI